MSCSVLWSNIFKSASALDAAFAFVFAQQAAMSTCRVVSRCCPSITFMATIRPGATGRRSSTIAPRK